MILAAAFVGAYMVGSVGRKLAKDAKFQRQARVQVWANERAHRQSDYERSLQLPTYEGQQPPGYNNLDIYQPPRYENINGRRTIRHEHRSHGNRHHRRTRHESLNSSHGNGRGNPAGDETRIETTGVRDSLIRDESVRTSDARPKWKRRLLKSTRFRHH